jgi:membrane protease YdiL (CAAX protease family)
MTRPTRPRTPYLYHGDPSVARPGAVVATFLVLGCTIVCILAASQVRPGMFQLVVAQLAFAAAAFAAAALETSPRSFTTVRQTLGLVAPRRRAVLGAVLIGSSAWYANVQVVIWTQSFTGPARVPQLEALMEVADLPLLVACVSLLPAFAEELVFRGLWARALAARLGPWPAILLTSLVFGAYHFSLVQLLPTALLGVLVAWASLRSGSLWLAMLVHALNNALAVLAARGHLGGLGAAMNTHPMIALVIALAITACGLALIASSMRTPAQAA